jgi:hypothetical protein
MLAETRPVESTSLSLGGLSLPTEDEMSRKAIFAAGAIPLATPNSSQIPSGARLPAMIAATAISRQINNGRNYQQDFPRKHEKN